MDGLSQFLAMGGHGGFIWGAYGIAAAVLVGLFAISRRELRRRERALRALEEAGGGRRRRR